MNEWSVVGLLILFVIWLDVGLLLCFHHFKGKDDG